MITVQCLLLNKALIFIYVIHKHVSVRMGKYYWNRFTYCGIFILTRYHQRQIRVEVDCPSYTSVLYELTILLA